MTDNEDLISSKNEGIRNGAPGHKEVAIENTFGSAMLEQQIQKNLLMHDLAARHYKARHFYAFVLSKGILIILSGALAFTDISDNAVGVLALIIAFLEAMSESLRYGTRAAMHEAVSVDLTNIRNRLQMLGIKLAYSEYLGYKKMKKREMMEKSKKTGTEVDDIDRDGLADYTDVEGQEDTSGSSDTFDSIRYQFEQSLSGCKSTIPVALSGAFDALDSTSASLVFSAAFADERKRIRNSEGEEYYGMTNGFMLRNIMFSQITRQRFFPFFLKKDYMVLVENAFAIWSSQTQCPNPFCMSAMNERRSTFKHALTDKQNAV